MLIHEGNRIGDAWYFVRDNLVHAYYLTSSMDIPPHVRWSIGHATSRDLVNWEIHDLALQPGPSGAWDDALATGSILYWKDRYWMAYTGHRTQQVGMAVSDDLFTWERQAQNPVTGIDTRYYEAIGSGERKKNHWRDPFLFEHEGTIYQYVCASRNDGPRDARGVLGFASSHDLIQWDILPPPETEPIAQELECPQVYKVGDVWYLLFSSGPRWFSKKHLEAIGGPHERFASYSMVGPSPMGPFRLHGSGHIIPPTPERQPYACQLVFLHGKAFLLGTVIVGESSGICDPIPVKFTPEGIRIKEGT
jgi:beta-fructofuranosidase